MRTKSPRRSRSAGRCGLAGENDSDTLAGGDARLRLKLLGAPAIPRPSTEAILPLLGTTSDQFDSRLAAWLADVAMNGQRTA